MQGLFCFCVSTNILIFFTFEQKGSIIVSGDRTGNILSVYFMKNLRTIAILLLLLVSLSTCEKSTEHGPVPLYSSAATPYEELEERIRATYDSRAVFTWDQYITLIHELSDKKFIVMPLNEMRMTYDNSKVVVGFRHDVDLNPFKALEMARIERDLGIRSTFFILPTSDYYGFVTRRGFVRNTGLDSLIRKIYETGAEIGIHNDLLTVMIAYHSDPFIFNEKDIAFYRSLNIPVYGTSSHGSPIAKKTVPNFQIFRDFAKRDTIHYNGFVFPIGRRSLKEYGYEYEAYFINFNKYFSESGGKWNVPGGFAGIIEKLKESAPGDRIEILTHPDWWGK